MNAHACAENDVDLLARVRAGDARAEEAVLRRWQCLVYQYAARSTIPRHLMSYEDLVQCLRITLLQCARVWDPGRGSAFSTYVCQAFVNAENRCRRKCRPVGIRSTAEPVLEVFSLDHVLSEGDDMLLQDRLRDPRAQIPYDQVELRAWVQTVLRGEPRLLRALWLHYGLDGGGYRSYAELAAVLEISSQGAYHRVRTALRRLRAYAEVGSL